MGPVAELVATAYGRLHDEGASDYLEIYTDAASRLEVLTTNGCVTAEGVAEALDWLKGRPQAVEAGNVLTAICLLAARKTEDSAIQQRVAAEHASLAASVAGELASARPTETIALTADARRVAIEFDLESTHPILVIRLLLAAARAKATSDGPLLVEALDDGRAALAIHRRIDGEGWRSTERTTRELAVRALRWASTLEPAAAGGAEMQGVLRAVYATFLEVGPHEEVAQTGSRLLRLLLEDHLHNEASELERQLRNELTDAGFDALLPERADLCTQRRCPAEALALLADLKVDRTAFPERYRYVQTIRTNALRQQRDFRAATETIDGLIEWMSSSAPLGSELRWARDIAHARMTKATITAELGDRARADALFEEIYGVFDDLQPTDDMRIDLPTIAAQALWDDGVTPYAGRWFDRAIETRDAVARSQNDSAEELSFRLVRPELDVRATRLAARSGMHRLALLRGEAGKAAVLARLSVFAGGSSPLGAEVRANLIEQIQALDAAKNAAATAMRTLGPGDPERARFASRVRALQDRRRRLVEQLEVRVPGRPSEHRSDQTLDDRLAKLIDSGAAVVSITSGVDGLVLAGVGPDGEASIVREHPTDAEIEEHIASPLRASHAGLSAAGGTAHWSDTLHKALHDLDAMIGWDLRRIFDQLGGDHRVLIPHRLLHSLPLTHISNGDGPTLSEQFGAFSVLPALAMYDIVATGPPRDLSVLAVARPDSRAPLMGLEGAALAELHGGELLIGDDANPSLVASTACGRRTVHFAVHGTYRPGSPTVSGLKLAPTPHGIGPFGTGDGLVAPHALLGLFDLSDTRLLVLSACDSALSDPSATDDTSGLAGYGLLAGADWVVASLWSVQDSTTIALMLAFYDALGTAAPPVALQRATEWLRTTPPAEVADSLARLEPIADRLGVTAQLAVECARLRARKEPLGPDAWAAFACYGAPRSPDTRSSSWHDDA